jgi:hypothetical protein
MVIDKNGVIDIQNLGIRVSPEYTLDEFKSNSNFKDFKYLGGNDGYERFNVLGIIINTLPFGATFIFYKSKISLISICYALYKHIPDEGWEKQKKIVDSNRKKHDELMLEQHGATSVKYQWGTIGSYLDEYHGYSAKITIRYNNSPLKPRPSLDKNGIVYIETLGIKIGSNFTLEELKNKEPNEHIKYAGTNNGYERYIINDLVDELPYSFLLLFNNHKIEFINIYYFIKITDKPTWETTSMEMYDEMMLKEYDGGNKMEYPWGTQCAMRRNKQEDGLIMIFRYKISKS